MNRKIFVTLATVLVFSLNGCAKGGNGVTKVSEGSNTME